MICVDHRISHSAYNYPEADRMVLLKLRNGEYFIGVYQTYYLGRYELQSINYDYTDDIEVSAIEYWTYLTFSDK